MSIQLRVEAYAIPLKWEAKRVVVVLPDHRCEGQECGWCQGAGCTREEPRLAVKFPIAGWVQSYAPDALVFDNASANMHLREELDAAGVRYTRG